MVRMLNKRNTCIIIPYFCTRQAHYRTFVLLFLPMFAIIIYTMSNNTDFAAKFSECRIFLSLEIRLFGVYNYYKKDLLWRLL